MANTCSICREAPTIVHKVVTIDGKPNSITGLSRRLNLISVDKLCNYKVIQSALQQETFSGELGQGSKLTVRLAAGANSTGNESSVPLSVVLCNKCIDIFEKLEGLYQTIEGLKTEIQAMSQLSSQRSQVNLSQSKRLQEMAKAIGEVTETLDKLSQISEGRSGPPPTPPVLQARDTGYPSVHQEEYGNISTVDGGAPSVAPMSDLTFSGAIFGNQINVASTGVPVQQQLSTSVYSGYPSNLYYTDSPGIPQQQPYTTMPQWYTSNGRDDIIMNPVTSHGNHEQHLIREVAQALLLMSTGHAQNSYTGIISMPPFQEQNIVTTEVAFDFIEEFPMFQEMDVETEEQEETTDYAIPQDGEELSELLISNVRSTANFTPNPPTLPSTPTIPSTENSQN